MLKQQRPTPEDRKRLEDLADAVSAELAHGRHWTAIAVDLAHLGFSRRDARRIVRTVMRSQSAPSTDRPDRARLAADGLLVLAGLIVCYACVAAQSWSAALLTAVIVVACGVADAVATLRSPSCSGPPAGSEGSRA